MGDDNIVSLEPKFQARAEAAAGRRVGVDLSAERFRMIARAVRQMRERGSSTNEIAYALRLIADELESGGKPA